MVILLMRRQAILDVISTMKLLGVSAEGQGIVAQKLVEAAAVRSERQSLGN
jgi:hypothetical protein